jgi:protein disulfide-isomerase
MPKDKPRTEYSTWTTMASALAESERNGKPILIDFNADWCPPCQRMKSEVFDNGVRGQAVQTAVIPVSIVDRIRENGHNPPEIENLQNRFGVNAFPTLVVFSPATGRMVRTQGFGGADQTVQWITEAAQFVR